MQRDVGFGFAFVFCATSALATAAGCGASDELVPIGNGTAAAAPPVDQSPEAKAGRSTTAGLLGGSSAAVDAGGAGGPAPTAEQARDATRHDALVKHLIQVIDQDEPQAMANFARAMAGPEGETIGAGYAAMRLKIEAAATSRQLYAALQKDPLFAGSITPASFFGDLAVAPQAFAGLCEDKESTESRCGPIPNLGQRSNGRYGDDSTGALGALTDLGGLTSPIPGQRPADLLMVDLGRSTPNPDSRLGAYAATAGYPLGTVGASVHVAIGTIYGGMGTYGEERIGSVFNDPAARALYNDPVDSVSGQRMAEIEQRYWDNVRQEDPQSMGGQLGASFSPSARDCLQRNVFGLGQTTGDGGSQCGTQDSCAGKADGLYCSTIDQRSAYECKGQVHKSAQYCETDGGGGSSTDGGGAGPRCTGPNGPGTTIQCN